MLLLLPSPCSTLWLGQPKRHPLRSWGHPSPFLEGFGRRRRDPQLHLKINEHFPPPPIPGSDLLPFITSRRNLVLGVCSALTPRGPQWD